MAVKLLLNKSAKRDSEDNLQSRAANQRRNQRLPKACTLSKQLESYFDVPVWAGGDMKDLEKAIQEVKHVVGIPPEDYLIIMLNCHAE